MKQDTKVFYKMVFALVFPMALQNLINVAVTSADVIMLGKVGETALSASSLAGQVQFIMNLIFFGITSGATVLTAQYWGKKDIRTIEKIMGIALRFSLIISILFTIAVQLFPKPIMSIFTPEPELIEEGAKYLKIISISYVITAITMVYLNIMRSVERVIISTVIYLISLLTNIVLNWIFIFGKFGLAPMGIRGAAIATVIARLVELIIMLFYAYGTKQEVKLNFADIFVKDKELFGDFLKYSLPVMANELMWGAGYSMNAVVMGHMGSSVVAANSVAQVARQLAMVVGFGVSSATAITIGKVIGENKYELAEEYAKRFVKLSLVFGVLGGIIILIARPIAIANLTLTPQAQNYLSMMMFVMAYYVIGQGLNTTLVVGVFRSGGDTKFGLVLDVSTMWGGSILLGAIAAFIFNWSVTAVYMILMCDEIIKIPFTIWRYRSKKWLKNVTR